MHTSNLMISCNLLVSIRPATPRLHSSQHGGTTQPAIYYVYDKSSSFVLFLQMTFVLIFILNLYDLRKDIVRWYFVSHVLQVILARLYT